MEIKSLSDLWIILKLVIFVVCFICLLIITACLVQIANDISFIRSMIELTYLEELLKDLEGLRGMLEVSHIIFI